MGRNSGGVGAGHAGRGPRLGARYAGAADLRGASHVFPLRGDKDTHNRKERIRQALRAGRGGDTFGSPIQVDVDRAGNAVISSGRHRVEVLREPEFAGRKLPTVFRRSRFLR